jgi:hypothetical protein
VEASEAKKFAGLDGMSTAATVAPKRGSNLVGKVCCRQKPQDTTALAAMQAQLHAESIERLLEAEQYLHRHQRTETEYDLTFEQRLERFRHLTTSLKKQEQEADLHKAMIRNNLDGGWIRSEQNRQRFAPIDVAARVDDDIYTQQSQMKAQARQVVVLLSCLQILLQTRRGLNLLGAGTSSCA